MKRYLYKNAINKRIRENGITVSSQDILKAFKASLGRGLQVWPLDSEYTVVDMLTIKHIIERSKVDKAKYIKDKRDCDKFARCVWAETSKNFLLNSFGLVLDFSAAHAYNAIVRHIGKNKLDILWLEPQNDKIFDQAPLTGAYLAKHGVVLI